MPLTIEKILDIDASLWIDSQRATPADFQYLGVDATASDPTHLKAHLIVNAPRDAEVATNYQTTSGAGVFYAHCTALIRRTTLTPRR